MRYIPITCEQREAMLRAVGVSAIDELFDAVPDAVRLKRPLALPGPLTEIELSRHLASLAGHNAPATGLVCLAGAGCYDHYIPSVVDHVARRPEFFTAYTPYQPEVSQGTLQAIYEFQSMVCELTGMDVANASMYDGATAFAEAALMACRVTKRSKVLCAVSVHPAWRATLATYAAAASVEVVTSPAEETTGVSIVPGSSTLESLLAGDDVAAVLVQSPNVLGCIEDVAAAAAAAHAHGALAVVAADPVLLGVLEAPGELGADIVVGEGQPLGNAMSFGGPGLGLFACREEFVRQMPGRLAGRTVDVDGAPAFVLTLSTREQHIRREKATSNICSNHGLNALVAGVYLAAVGRSGLQSIARDAVQKACYLKGRLIETGRFAPVTSAPYAREFALRYDGDVERMRSEMLERGYLAGVGLAELCAGSGRPAVLSDQDSVVLFAVTEKRTREELDAFVREVSSL